MGDPAYPNQNKIAPQPNMPPPAYPGQGTSGQPPPPPPAAYAQPPPPQYGAHYGGAPTGPQYGGAPMGAQYGGMHGGAMTTVVVNQQQRFGSTPIRTKCTSCQADITTHTETKIGSYAWMMVGIMVLIGFVVFLPLLLGCCFIPLCIPSLKDVEHSCPNCKTVLGCYQRSRGI